MTKPLSPTVEARIERSARAFTRKILKMPAAELMRHVSHHDIPVHLIARRCGGKTMTMKWHLGDGGDDATACTFIPVSMLRFTHAESGIGDGLADAARSALTAHAASTPGAVATSSDG